jgi:carbonic anhydrase
LNTLLVLSAVGNKGKKGVVMVVHHTDCGLQSISDDEIKEVLRKSVESDDGVQMLNDMKFGSIHE